MSVEERIRFLTRAALRAEREGAARVARSLRRMAEQARPLDVEPHVSFVEAPLLSCAD